MSTDETRLPDQLKDAARISGLGDYEASHRPPLRIPWTWTVLPAIILVTGLLSAFGVIELEPQVRNPGTVNTATSLFGAAIGAVALVAIPVSAVRRRNRSGGVHLYRHGFAVESGGAVTLLRYDSLLAEATRDGNGRTVYRVRTAQQPSWTTVPGVADIDRLGPMLLHRAGNVPA